MTTLWTCDIDENEIEERCANEATHIVTWFDEADEEEGRAGQTLKVCAAHREIRSGVLETPGVVDVGVARIDRAAEPESAARPMQWCWSHLQRGEFVHADTVVGLDDSGHVTAYEATDPATQFGFCSTCIDEHTCRA